MCWGWQRQCGWHNAMVVPTPVASNEVGLTLLTTTVGTTTSPWCSPVFSTPVVSAMVTPIVETTELRSPGCRPSHQRGLHDGGFQLGGLKRGCVDVMAVSSLGTPWVAGQRCVGWAGRCCWLSPCL